MSGTSKRRRLERALGLVISAVALGGCLWWASKQQAPRFPSSASGWALIVLAVLLYGVATLARAWRWHVILRHARVDHQFADAAGVTTVGYMGNNVLPLRGGEVLRILVMAGHSSGRRRDILGSIVPERVLDAAALAVLFAALTLIEGRRAPTGATTGVVAAAVVAAGAIALFSYHRLRVAGHFEAFATRVRPVARASRLLVTPWGLGLGILTMGVWLLEGFIFVLCARSLSISLTVVEGFLAVVLASFFAMIPAAPGYVGTYDAALLVALKAAKVTGGDALGITLLFRFVVFVPITIIGLALLLMRYGGFATLRSAQRTADEGLVVDDPRVDVREDLVRASAGPPSGV